MRVAPTRRGFASDVAGEARRRSLIRSPGADRALGAGRPPAARVPCRGPGRSATMGGMTSARPDAARGSVPDQIELVAGRIAAGEARTTAQAFGELVRHTP